MASSVCTESIVEDATLVWLASLGCAVLNGLGVATGELWVKVAESIGEATA